MKKLVYYYARGVGESKKIRRIVWKDAIFHLVFSFFNAPKFVMYVVKLGISIIYKICVDKKWRKRGKKYDLQWDSNTQQFRRIKKPVRNIG